MPTSMVPPSTESQYTGPSIALVIGIICGIILVVAVGSTTIIQIQKRRRKAQDMSSIQSQPDVIRYTKESEKHTDSMRPIPIGQQIILPRHPQASYSVSSFNSAQSRVSLDDTKSTTSLVPDQNRLEDIYITNVGRRGYPDHTDLNYPPVVPVKKPKVDEKYQLQISCGPSTASSGVDPLPSPRRRVGLPSNPSPRTSQFAEMPSKQGAAFRRAG